MTDMQTSRFHALLRSRFESNWGSKGGDPVPWELDDKNTAYRWVESRGFQTPRSETFDSVGEALASEIARDSRFVLKRPQSHSSRGTYPLQRLADGRLFDRMRLTATSERALAAFDEQTPQWIIEEWLDSGVHGSDIPLDYKIFVFNGHPLYITQIDRNSFPARTAIFDACFIPLRHGVDYTFDESKARPGGHVIPRHAAGLLQLARTLAPDLHTAFVRIDCYDTPRGAVFGEFTFAAGTVDAGAMQFSTEMLQRMDDALDAPPRGALSGFDIDLEHYATQLSDVPSLRGTGDALSLVAAGAPTSDRRYAHAVLRHVDQDAANPEVLELAIRVLAVLNGDRRHAFPLSRLLRKPTGAIRGDARWGEYWEIALAFHSSKANISQWHAMRVGQLRADRGDPAGFSALQQLVDDGYTRAGEALSAYSG